MRFAALLSFLLALAMCRARPSDKKENLESAKISTQKRETLESQDFGDLLQEQKVTKAAKSQPGPSWKKSFIPSKTHQHLWGSRSLRENDDDQSYGLWGRSLGGQHVSGLWGRSTGKDLWGRSLQTGLWGRSPQSGSRHNGLWGRSLQTGLWGRSVGSHHGLWGRSLNDQYGLWGRSLEDKNGLLRRSVKAASNGVKGLWGRSVKGPVFDKSSRSNIPMWRKRFGPTKIGVWGRGLNKGAVQNDGGYGLWGKRNMNEASKMTSASENAK